MPIISTSTSLIEITSPSISTVQSEIFTTPDKSLKPGDYYIENESGTNISRFNAWCGDTWCDCVGHTDDKLEVFSVKKKDDLYVINAKDPLGIDTEYWTAILYEDYIILDNDYEGATRWIIEFIEGSNGFYLLQNSRPLEPSKIYATLNGKRSAMKLEEVRNSKPAKSQKFKFKPAYNFE